MPILLTIFLTVVVMLWWGNRSTKRVAARVERIRKRVLADLSYEDQMTCVDYERRIKERAQEAGII